VPNDSPRREIQETICVRISEGINVFQRVHGRNLSIRAGNKVGRGWKTKEHEKEINAQ